MFTKLKYKLPQQQTQDGLANLRCCMNRTWKLTLLRSLINSESNLVPRVLSLPPSRKYPGFGWSRVSLKQTAPHQGGLAFLQEAKRKANANLFKQARRQRNGSHQLTFFSKTGMLKKSTDYYLRRFRSTNNADFPSTKYFTVGSICFEFAEGV